MSMIMEVKMFCSEQCTLHTVKQLGDTHGAGQGFELTISIQPQTILASQHQNRERERKQRCTFEEIEKLK